MITPSRLSLLLVCAVLAEPLALDTAAAQLHGSLPDTARISAVLDSLEHVALTATDPSVRARAALTITNVGRRHDAGGRNDAAPPEPRFPSVLARLATVYRKSADPAVRNLIVQWMPALVDRRHAIAFLMEVASEAPEPDARRPAGAPGRGHATSFSRAYVAVYALTRMGAEGRAALARLDVNGTVRDPDARAYLARLANEGYENHQ